MDFLPHLSAIAGLLLAIVLVTLNLSKSRTAKRRSPPEPSGSWPLIGHLLRLGGPAPLFRILAALADEHGPVFVFRLGVYPVLVVSSWEAVKDCFTTNDRALASRPVTTSGDCLSYDGAAFGFAPYGPYWREIRKLALIELLSNRRLEMLGHVRVSEVAASIRELYCHAKGKNGVIISEWIEQLTLNMIVRMIAGKRYFNSTGGGVGDDGHTEEAKHFRMVIKEFMLAIGDIVWSDVVPFPLFRLIDSMGKLRVTKRILKDLDTIIQSWVDEHLQRRLDGQPAGDEQDFIDVLLSVIDDTSIHGHARETVIKATIMNLIVAGSDTTSVNLTWILAILMNNKHVLKQAQEEIDTKVGQERWVEESDIKNLSYLKAIVKETMRLYPPGPLSVQHIAMEDCEIAGYSMAKGTRLMVNVWKLHRDPRIWTEPEEFRPERFLTTQAEVDVYGQHFEYSPFGSGRRSCPGIGFAMQVTHLTVARLLQGFDFATPGNGPVDMTEGLGLTLSKATPLEIVVTPRLSSQHYG